MSFLRYFSFLVLALLQLQATAQTDAELERQVDQIIQEERCIGYTNITVAEIERMLDMYYFDKTSSRLFPPKFEKIRENHRKHFAQIKTYAQPTNAKAKTKEELLAAIENLESDFSKFNAQGAQIRQEDEEFLTFIGEAERAFLALAGFIDRIPPGCAPSLVASFGRLRPDLVKRREEITLARKYVADARIKRDNLINMALEAKRLSLQKAFAEQSRQRLEDVRALIKGHLDLADLNREVIMWFARINGNGMGDGKALYYLQYEPALAALGRERLQALSFRERVLQVPGVSDESRKIVLNTVDSAIAGIDETRKLIEGRGWKGTFERHKMLIARRRQIIDKYPDACRGAMEKYDRAAVGVNSAKAFADMEDYYIQVVDACKVPSEGGAR